MAVILKVCQVSVCKMQTKIDSDETKSGGGRRCLGVVGGMYRVRNN
jgi:hypothetical protein